MVLMRSHVRCITSMMPLPVVWTIALDTGRTLQSEDSFLR